MKTKITTLLFIFGMIIKSQATTVTVQILSSSFSPNSINVSVGDTVLWSWATDFHSSTSTSVPIGANSWDSGVINSGATFNYVVKVSGVYQYKCSPHGFTGTINAIQAGIKENRTGNTELIVFPNPAENVIHISTKDFSTHYSVSIYDYTGKKINCADFSNGKQNLVELNGIPSGIYWVELRTNGYRRVTSFIKN